VFRAPSATCTDDIVVRPSVCVRPGPCVVSLSAAGVNAFCHTWRMRVSAKSDYPLRALIEIAGHTDGSPVPAEGVGRTQGIPRGFLLAILADLRRAGIVSAQRGQSGGWRLARTPDQISVADVIRAVDGPLVSVYDVRPEVVSYTGSAEILQFVWIAARSSLREVFESVTLEALVAQDLPDAVMLRTSDEDAWLPR
jgi:Rrf2 family protein